MGTNSSQELRQSSTGLLLAGILAIIVGVLAIAVPAVASVSIAVLVGILVIVLAVVWLFAAIGSETSTGWRITGIILSVLLLIGGLWILFNPIEATIGLTAVIAIVFIVMGVVRLAAAIGGGGDGRWLIAVGGVLSIIIGVLISVDFPSSAAWAIGLLVGIQFLFDGIGLVMVSMAMKGVLKGPGGPPAAA